MNITELTTNKTTKSYPNIFVIPNIAAPAIVRNLQEGDIQLIMEHNGVKKVVSRISPSARNMDMILRVIGPFEYNKSEIEKFQIKCVQDYLDCCI